MFDLPPPRHISTLRVWLLAVRPGEGLLTERTADARGLSAGTDQNAPNQPSTFG